MTDMREKMARALIEADLRRTSDYEKVYAKQIIEEGWSGWINYVDAVIEAMVPTNDMLLAGARSIGKTMGQDNHIERARSCWQAMLAALEGK